MIKLTIKDPKCTHVSGAFGINDERTLSLKKIVFGEYHTCNDVTEVMAAVALECEGVEELAYCCFLIGSIHEQNPGAMPQGIMELLLRLRDNPPDGPGFPPQHQN